ncbi:MAG TPA: DUF3617 domain-containing protein [Allosphingosinicella sp.]|jgi:hypothetical protein
MRQWIGIAAALALAGCGGGGEGGDANKAAGNAGGNAGAGAEGGEAGGGGGSASLQPGQWEITTNVTSMNVPGMPAGMTPPMPPPTTVRACLTAAQAAQPGAGFLSGSGEAQGCTYESNSIGGGRIQAVVQCNQAGTTMRSTMTGQFTADSYEVNQQVETSAQGQNMQIQSRTTGRRVGDCPA